MEKGPGLLVRYATADRPSPVLLRQLPLILSFLCFSSAVIADLPQELDPFLERLFETVECEAFLADSSFLAVSTRDCPPTTCDFPRLLCMRPSASYKDERANQCRAIPEECLIAANGGQPPQSPAHSTRPPTAAPQPRPADLVTSTLVSVSTELPLSLLQPPPKDRIPSVKADFPPVQSVNRTHQNRFCGFALKFAFNRETRSCDQFWFPGCRTAETNDNLFDTSAECLEASRHCLKPTCSSRAPCRLLTEYRTRPPGGPSASPPPQPNPVPFPNQPQPTNNGGGALGSFNQAGQFIRMITNTIREVRERGDNISQAQAPRRRRGRRGREAEGAFDGTQTNWEDCSNHSENDKVEKRAKGGHFAKGKCPTPVSDDI